MGIQKPFLPYLFGRKNTMQKVLIIGGSRFIGPFLVEELLFRGHEVTVFNRGRIQKQYPDRVRFIPGDRNDGFGVKERFDAVIDMCAMYGAHTAKAINELVFDFFVNLGTAAVYEKSELFPLTEESNLGNWSLWGDYNRGKVECERVLAKSGVSYASLRPVYILGPRNYLLREAFIYAKLKRGEPLILPGNGQALLQFIHAREVAASLALIMEKRIEGVFNCAGDKIVTLRGLIEEMAGIVHKEPHIEYNPKADGWRFNAREFPFANENFVVANDKIKGLGARFAPISEFLRSDYDNYYEKII